jgi:hypothetical protein
LLPAEELKKAVTKKKKTSDAHQAVRIRVAALADRNIKELEAEERDMGSYGLGLAARRRKRMIRRQREIRKNLLA